MATSKRFHLQIDSRERAAGVPSTVPWSLVEGHEEQAQINHSQSLEVLDGRGGLDIVELWCLVHHKKWRDRPAYDDVLAWVLSIPEVVP